MSILYLLNESNEPAAPGDVRIYRRLEGLTTFTEPIDVQNGEYFAFVSDGRRIALSAETDRGPVEVEIEDSPTHIEEVESLLRAYLLRYADDARFDVDGQAVRDAKGLSGLKNLIPERFIVE